MEREHKKRCREPKISKTALDPKKAKKKKQEASPFLDNIAKCGGDVSKRPAGPAANRPVGVFEFPWEKEKAAYWDDGCDIRDVFFSSLVDGCSAAIGLPWDRLFRAPQAIVEDLDGVDCIWSCALNQPITAFDNFKSSCA